MKFVFILSSLLCIGKTIASPIDSVRSEQREQGLFVIHEVEESETIYAIARRYGSSVTEIITHNQIQDNRIDIGQLLAVLIKKQPSEKVNVPLDTASAGNVHIVKKGETLYSIARKYKVKLKELRRWNNLSDNNISQGMELKLEEVKIPTPVEVKAPTVKEIRKDSAVVVEKDPYADFKKYLVQTGETLTAIAEKVGVSIDSLRSWNKLRNDYLKIGQQLFFKEGANMNKPIPPKKDTQTKIDEKGFEKIYEEGIASVIQSMETTRFLALHRTLPIGTNLKVRNLMNNQVVHVKVVGKLPDTGLNKNLLLRLSRPAYDQLGILDAKSRVEVSYHKE